MTTGQRRTDWWQVALVVTTILAVLVLGVAEPRLSAQVRRGSLSGAVADQTGAVIAGAQVSLTSEATGVAVSTITNGSGYFYFASVEPSGAR